MKEEMQKSEMENIESCPRENRLEAEGIVGAQTFMEITEGELTEVRIENERLKKLYCSDERSWGTGVCSFNEGLLV